MNDLMAYFARIGAAILLIKYASVLVKDAERLITANAKTRLPPDVIEQLDEPPYGQTNDIQKDETEWSDPDMHVGVGRHLPADDPADPGIIAQREEFNASED